MTIIRKAGLLHVNSQHFGIPQGTPISAVFANISMLSFDRKVGEWANQNAAYYRRYSDDIIIIVEPAKENAARAVIEETAASTGHGLTIHPDKTEVSRFLPSNGDIEVDRPLTYLGFTFNGRTVMLRARTLSRYYRRMTYAARGTVRGARRAGKLASLAHRRSVYRELTHLGSNNFYQYAKRADAKFHQSSVKRQLKRHFQILIRKLGNKGR